MAYIALDRTKTVANAIAQLTADAIALRAESARVIALINSITAGGATPTNLETTAMGCPAGSGSTIYSTVHDTIYLNSAAMTASLLAGLDNG